MISTKTPTTSKNKSASLKEQTAALAAERAGQLAEAEASRDALRETRDSLSGQADTILSEWASGDDAHDADALKQVRGELERVEALLGAAERVVRQADRRLINTDDDLTELLIPAIKSAYAVPVSTTTVEPTPRKDLPELVIVQLEPTSHEADTGSLSGNVELRYYRTEAHAPLTSDRLEEHLRAAGVRVRVGQEYARIQTTPISGGHLDSAHVRVFEAFPTTPTITDPGSIDHVKAFSKAVAYELEGRFVTYSNTGAAAYPERISCHGSSTKERRDSKDGTTSVTIAFDLDYGNTPWLKADMAKRIPAVLDGFEGTGYSGLGRLESTAVKGNKTLMNSFGYPAGTSTSVEATFVSRAA